MLGLLQREAQARWRLDEVFAPQVFDIIPRNSAKPLEVHDSVVAQCLLPIEEPVVVVGCVRGGVLDLLMDGEDNFRCGSCVENAVSDSLECVNRLLVRGQAACDALSGNIGLGLLFGLPITAGSPSANSWPHVVHHAHLRLLACVWFWVLTTYLRHQPAMRRRGVVMSWGVRVWHERSRCHVNVIGAAESVSQLSRVGDVLVMAFPNLLVLSLDASRQRLRVVIVGFVHAYILAGRGACPGKPVLSSVLSKVPFSITFSVVNVGCHSMDCVGAWLTLSCPASSSLIEIETETETETETEIETET